LAGGNFITFMRESKSKNNTTSVLMIRPAQSIVFEAGALWAADCIACSSPVIW